MRLSGLRIVDLENFRSDLDQVRVEFSPVPFVKDRSNFLRAQSKRLSQEIVSLRDQLHVAVLDTVMHHLHEVPGAVGADSR